MKHTNRLLVEADRATLEAFLAGHAESSMFLRGNLRARGIGSADSAEGNYFGSFRDHALVGVASHSWTGMVLVQAPEPDDTAELAKAAVAASGRRVAGISGPYEQAIAARAGLGMATEPVALDSREALFTLDLAKLLSPAGLKTPEWRVRPPQPGEGPLLIEWRCAYGEEALGIKRAPGVEARAAADIVRWTEEGVAFVLEVAGEPVSFAAFNTRLPDIVQIGGVWTPPALRGRGYGAAAVGGALEAARSNGARRAVLFTDEENRAAIRAYEKLGFTRVGDYGLIIFGR